MLFKPFDYNPVSVSVKTGSYSIPAGRYAYVVPECDDSNFTIDGNSAVQSRQYSINGSVPSVPGGGARTLLTTNNNLGPIKIKGVSDTNFLLLRPAGGSSGGTDDITIHDSTDPTKTQEITFNVGDSLYFKNDGGLATVSYNVTGYRLGINYANGFWVPTGTSLNGDRYTVAEYIIPT